MTKIRKQKKKKTYRYNATRNRINKRLNVTESNVALANTRNSHVLSQKSFEKLGFVYDVNQDIKHMNKGHDIHLENLNISEGRSTSTLNVPKKKSKKPFKAINFRFSKDQVDYLTYLLEKYGDDFKAMSRDKKNYLQQTWKQIRYKINLFKSIPDHYNEFLRNKKS